MAEKILNTRVLLKIDTLENWMSSTLPLKKGELALATVAASAGTGLTEPVVMIKVGEDGVKTFKDLEWNVYAKASDVLAACKNEDSLKAFINGVIADAGIATDEALTTLAGRVTTAEGEIDTLQSEMDAVEAKASANEAAIGALETQVGEKNVATQISEAITALDLANTYDAKGAAASVQTALDTYKNSNDAKILEHTNAIAANTNAIAGIKDGETLDSFKDVETALAGKEAAGAAAQALTDAKAYADGLAGNYDAKGAAATAESNAKAYAKEYADGLAGNYDAAGSAADALADANEYTDGEIAEWVGDKTVGTQISEAITGLDLANTYAAKSHKHVKADITDFAHTHEISEVNGLQDALDGKQAVGDYATKAEAQGYADAKDEAIAAAKKAGDDAQAEVDALETYVGTFTHDTAKSVVEYIDAKTAGIATDAALAELQGKVTAIENDYLVEADKTALQDQITANDGEIAALQGLVGEKGVAEQISAVTDPLAGRVNAIEDDYLKSADKTELQGNIDTVSAAVERLTNGVSAEEVDGVNDLIQYVKDHGTEVTGIKADIKANADAIDAIEADYLKAADKTELSNAIAAEKSRAEGIEGGLETRLQAVESAVGESGSVAGDIADALSEAKGYTDTEVKELADGAVATNAAAIEALEGLVGENSVSTQITNVTNPLDERVQALEAIDHEHANKTVLDGIEAADVTAWDAKVDDVTAAADSGLKATRTGNTVAIEIDDSVTFVFDCGDSSNV